MPSAAVSLLHGIDQDEVLQALEGFHNYHLAVMHWAYAVQNRLEGQAAFLLPDELEHVAKQNLEAARAIAERIGDLDGAVSGDPRELIANSPLPDFALPRDCSKVDVILGYALEQLATVTRHTARSSSASAGATTSPISW